MSTYNDSNLQDRRSRATEAKSAMLAKFKRALDPKNPTVIENRRQREAIAKARAERLAQREAARLEQEHELAKQAAIAAEAAAQAERVAAEEAAREAPPIQWRVTCSRNRRRNLSAFSRLA